MTSSHSVSVLLFASYADAFGARRLSVPLPDGARVADLVEALRQLPGGTRLPAAPLVAVNRAMAEQDRSIAPDDEIALIPPVAGG